MIAAAKELGLQKRNLSETISLLVSAFAQRFEDTGSNINDGEIIQRNNHFLLHWEVFFGSWVERCCWFCWVIWRVIAWIWSTWEISVNHYSPYYLKVWRYVWSRKRLFGQIYKSCENIRCFKTVDVHSLINQQLVCSKYLNILRVEPAISTLHFIQPCGNNYYHFHEFWSEIKGRRFPSWING